MNTANGPPTGTVGAAFGGNGGAGAATITAGSGGASGAGAAVFEKTVCVMF